MSGIFSKVFAGNGKTEARGGWEVVLEAWNNNRESAINEPLENSSALRMSAVFACIRVLSETVGSLPLIVYERQGEGRRRAMEHPLYRLLHDDPNPDMTSMEYREVLQNHLVSWGNAYSQIIYDSKGQIERMRPLLPWNILGDEYRDGVRYYQYQQEDGKTQWLSQFEIWHLRGLGDDGRWGYNPIRLMRRAIRLGMNAEEFGARFFENDARPGIILEHPQVLSDEAYKRLKSSWEDNHKGASKSHKPDILEEGMKLHEVGIPPEDAQFLETRKFQVEEIARIFRVPPHMIGDLDRATYSNIEHQGLEFVMYSLRPWLVRWEQSIDKNLMLEGDRGRFYAEHLVEGLLRSDIKSRYESYAIGRQWGWLSANDIRKLENMSPVEGGDAYLVPMNMTSPTSPTSPKPSPEGEGE